jgi:hypothetical protein
MQNFHKVFLSFLLLFFLASFAISQSPHYISQFEVAGVGEDGWADVGWWAGFNSVTRIDDPTGRSAGVLQLDCASANNGPGINRSPLDAEGAYDLSVMVYLPADFPDSGFVQWWGQDNDHWSHFEDTPYYGVDLPKEHWVPINFHLMSRFLTDSSTFNPYDYQFGWCGVRVTVPDENWSGIVLLDDIARVGADPIEVADFEVSSLGTQGFGDPGWGTATTVDRIDDPTGLSSGVLGVTMAGDNSFIEKSNIATERDQEILSYKIWLPSDFPDSMAINTVIQENVHWNDQYRVVDYGIDLPKEQWVLIEYELMHYFLIDSTLYHPYPPNGIGRIYVNFNNATYNGTIYVDEVRLLSHNKAGVGILQSPEVTMAATIDTVLDATTDRPLYHHLIEWQDLPVSMNETYNIYMSETGPITNVSAPGVIKVSEQVPRQTQEWFEPLYSINDEAATRYYAITATAIVGGEVVETPVRLDTSNTQALNSAHTIPYHEIPLVESFDFVVDGDIFEFRQLAQTFTRSKLYCTNANGPAVDYLGEWDPNDLDFEAYLVMDADNLYIGFEVTDDNPTGAEQPWRGDGLDVFGIFMDWTDITSRFFGTDVPNNGAGGFRISYAPNAATYEEQLQRNGGGAWSTTTGVDHGADVWEDGYAVEIKVPFTTGAAEFGGDVFVPANNMLFPAKIDVNDNDDSTDVAFDGELRTLQAHWGAQPGNFSSWLRSDGWTPMIITTTPLPVSIDDNGNIIPQTTELYQNYPNPFNPMTTIKYYLDKTTDVKLVIYNALGQKVQTLVNKEQYKGKYQVYWRGTNDQGSKVASGYYFVKLETENYSKVQKMLLLK